MTKSILTVLFASALLFAVPVAIAQTAKPDDHHPEANKPAVGQPMPGRAAGPGMQGGSGGMPMMDMMKMMGGMMAPHEHVEGRLAFLRTELGITPAQDPAWSAFADAVRKGAKDMGMNMMAGMQGGGWIANLERHETMMSKRLESVRALKGPASALYAQLSEPQKKSADTLMMGHMGPMGPM